MTDTLDLAPTIAVPSETVFPPEEYDRRITAIQARLRAEGAEALLLTGPENIFWATGRQTAGYFAFQALVVQESGAPRDVVARDGHIVHDVLDLAGISSRVSEDPG